LKNYSLKGIVIIENSHKLASVPEDDDFQTFSSWKQCFDIHPGAPRKNRLPKDHTAESLPEEILETNSRA
jgi:hypothetical protein